ncbi:uncharacterized protein LOC126745288 [Anthonomus grandis grandis]|uniref:uncharacterized protein LOC126745288 n=1 Tax=Anthonomus grandis grandis TaxID=2921223 RepID=UPI0021657F8E|nr:uncharacterized protein LOC126745288 [Anthonomus grandis grandis]
MKIYPKCEHIEVSMITSSLFGIFPSQFMFQSNATLQKYYKIYAYVIAAYFSALITTQYMELYVIIEKYGMKMDAISANLTLTLLYTIVDIRQFIIKFNPRFRNLIGSMIKQEALILGSKDNAIISIYKNYAKATRKRSMLYVSVIAFIAMQYFLRPLFLQIKYQVGNETISVKSLPLSTWIPFDIQAHYLSAYLWQLVFGLIGASSIMCTDIFMYNLISYPCGQLQIMHYILKNFEQYQDKCKRLSGISSEELAGCMTFYMIIEEHKKIIQFVNDFNSTLSMSMVFDFLQSSLQIASVISQIIGNPLTYDLFLFVFSSFSGMLLRLILYYYYANDVILLVILSKFSL